jgi:hypothetical protein
VIGISIKIQWHTSSRNRGFWRGERNMIHTMGFDDEVVQQALAQADGNEELAINFILNRNVRDASIASNAAATIAEGFATAAPAVSFSARAFGVGPAFGFGTAFPPAFGGLGGSGAAASAPAGEIFGGAPSPFVFGSFGFGGAAASAPAAGLFGAPAAAAGSSSSSMSSNVLAFTDHLTGRPVSVTLVVDGKLLSPAQLRAQIKRPLELMKASAWFFARQSPDIKRRRDHEEPPPPLGYMLAEFSPCVPVRVMFGCVATACRRLVTAPAGVYVFYRATDLLERSMMDRVTRGRVKKVQVRLLQHARCAVHCASHATAYLHCVYDACCRKRWLVFRSVAPRRSGCIKRATAFILVCSLLLPPALQADATLRRRH